MEKARNNLKDNAKREQEIAEMLQQIKQQRDDLNKKAEEL